MSPRAVVEAPAGLAAFSLAIHGGRHCRPPISRMGNKAGYAHALADIAGIRLGSGAGAYVWCEADADVAALLRVYPDPAALTRIAEIIRGWADEEPRALWERLRAERKVRGPSEEPDVSGWILSSAWGATGQWCGPDRGGACGTHPTGWVGSITIGGLTDRCSTLAAYAQIAASNRLINVAGPDLVNTGKGGTTFGGAEFATPAGEVASGFERVAGWAIEATWAFRKGEPESGFNPGAVYARPATATEHGHLGRDAGAEAAMFDRARSSRWPPVLVSRRILTAAEIADALGTPGDLEGVLYYSDPPYVGTTGYGADYGREEVVRDCLAAAAMGARVMVSEAVPVEELVAHGWDAVDIDGERKGQKRTFARVASEWVTCSFAPVSKPAVQQGLFAVTG